MQTKTPTQRLEIHTHTYVRGPLANRPGATFEHAHEGGDTGHAHADTGPAAFAIDKDAWYAATGLRGGGRKTYARRPTGPQLERVALEDWQTTFKVVFCDRGLTPEHERAGETELDLARMRREFQAAAAGTLEPVPDDGAPGNGGAAVARMAMQFDMTPVYVYEDLRPATGAAS